MSGFQYQCDHCEASSGDVTGQMIGASCPSCGIGRLRLSPEWFGQEKKLLPFPGGGVEEGGEGARDPTGPLSSARIDETLPVDIGKVVDNVGEIDGQEVGTDVGLGSDLNDDELPISCYVRARSRSQVGRKMIRTWKRMGHPVVAAQCSECRQTCVMAASTQRVIDDAWERGERYEVICDDCADAKGLEDGGCVAVQAEELQKVQRRVLEESARGRGN